MENILLVNSCIKGREESRTYELATFFINKYVHGRKDVNIKEIAVNELNIKPFTKEMIAERDDEVKEKKTDKLIKLAKEFAQYDTIVIAAPYWDMMFPSALKIYYEHISVSGITFAYGEKGEEIGLCKAKKAVYITTAGGYIGNRNFGYEYTKSLFNFMGINDIYFIKAEGLDIIGNDAEKAMIEAKKEAEILSEKI